MSGPDRAGQWYRRRQRVVPVYSGVGIPTNSVQSTNYWTDIVFSLPDLTPPLGIFVNPPASATGVLLNSGLRPPFIEPAESASVSTSTIEIRNAANQLVNATVSYKCKHLTLSPFSPSSALANGTTYTVTLKGGTNGVKDVAEILGQRLYLVIYDITVAQHRRQRWSDPRGYELNQSFQQLYYGDPPCRRSQCFAVADISTVTTNLLNNYDVVIVGEVAVNSTQASLFTTWVNAGGNADRLPAWLFALPLLLGLTAANTTMTDKYPAPSIPGWRVSRQWYRTRRCSIAGAADLYSITSGSGTVSVANIYSTSAASTVYPAVTMDCRQQRRPRLRFHL